MMMMMMMMMMMTSRDPKMIPYTKLEHFGIIRF